MSGKRQRWGARAYSRAKRMLNDITLYWLNNVGASSSRFYWENNNNFSSDTQKTKDIKVPVAITAPLLKEIYKAPESWSKQRAYPRSSISKTGREKGAFLRLRSNRRSSPRNCEPPPVVALVHGVGAAPLQAARRTYGHILFVQG